MKKIFTLCLCLVALFAIASCQKEEQLIVYTEAGFAPFEYISGNEIVGVDVDIMNKVGEKLGKKVVFKNVSFDIIVDTVSQGKLTNVGAAGLSITPERQEKVDFSKVYYQANLYVIYNKNAGVASKEMTDGNTGVYWSSLQTSKGIGVQGGTTADFFLSDEVAKGGSLEGIKKTDFQDLGVAVSAIGNSIDYVIIDELPAKQLVKGNPNLECLPLYYEGGEGEQDELAFDEYAICVTKGQEDLLAAINEVLTELLEEKDENGVNGIQKLVNKHLGLS
jgi:polar amino acid transport system substrate-binding protein